MTTTDRYQRFRELHQSGCFLIPNPWDQGSARLLARMGFPALATTSSGFAWTLGRSDNHITVEEALVHFRAIASAVDVPVNGDFEAGFAVEPERVAANVTAAAATGIAGLSIEDSTGDASSPLFDFTLAVERVRAARQAIDARLVDEIFLDLVPVILGGGTPFFAPGKGYELEGPLSVIESASVTHLRYKVKYEAAQAE